MKQLKDYTETNKLLAEFEGYKIDWGYKKNSVLMLGTVVSVKKLQYHCTWNWLIPVVEKINKVVMTELTVSQRMQFEYLEQRLSPYSYSMESIYKSVVEFVKWYNHHIKNK